MIRPPISTDPASNKLEENPKNLGDSEILAKLQASYQLHQAGQIENALAQYHQILEKEPENTDALYLAGVAYFQVQDFVQAELFLETALSLAPERSEILINLGNCRHAQSRVSEALEAYSQAIAADPNIAEAHNNYGNVLRELGRFEEAEAAFRQALDLQPDYLSAQSNLAATLRSLNRLEDAETQARKALKLNPDFDPALTTLGRTLHDLGQSDEAITALEKAMKINPEDLMPSLTLVNIWQQRGELEKALHICETHLQNDPHETRVLSVKALLLNEIGGIEMAKPLLDFERFILPKQFDQVSGYDSLKSFHTALHEYAEKHPDLQFEPLLKSTRQGFQAEQLERDDSLPIEAMKDLIAQGVEQYCGGCESRAGHPLAPPPEDLSVTFWVTILESTGYQHPHIHPSAWLSGVYYVNLPETMEQNTARQAGWIEFGRPSNEEKYKAKPLLHTVQPKEGLMVLFPSYIFHRTIPVAENNSSTSTEKRISIAFDVLAN